MADALFSTGFSAACLCHADKVTMANIAPIVNERGPIFVHPEGIVKRTTFHLMKMYPTELEPNTKVHTGKHSYRLNIVMTCIEVPKAIHP